ncbi:phage scaffolding protein [Enterococcus sp. N249-2]
MEWIKEILAKHVGEDGKFDLDGATKEIKSEFPKNAVPKVDFNDKSQKLKTVNEDLIAANTLVEQLKASNSGNEDLQKQIDDYKNQLETVTAERLADRKNAAIELALTQAGAKNITAVKALLKADELEMTDEGVKWLDDKVATLKKDEAYLFQTNDPAPEPKKKQFVAGGNTGGGEPPKEKSWKDNLAENIAKTKNN